MAAGPQISAKSMMHFRLQLHRPSPAIATKGHENNPTIPDGIWRDSRLFSVQVIENLTVCERVARIEQQIICGKDGISLTDQMINKSPWTESSGRRLFTLLFSKLISRAFHSKLTFAFVDRICF
jgi:hypothetical protein